MFETAKTSGAVIGGATPHAASAMVSKQKKHGTRSPHGHTNSTVPHRVGQAQHTHSQSHPHGERFITQPAVSFNTTSGSKSKRRTLRKLTLAYSAVLMLHVASNITHSFPRLSHAFLMPSTAHACAQRHSEDVPHRTAAHPRESNGRAPSANMIDAPELWASRRR